MIDYETFDFGTDITNLQINHFKDWPKRGLNTALVDADSIAYIIGYTSDATEYLRAKNASCFKESAVWLDKINQADYILNKWVENAGCDSCILFLTDSANNFRIDIAKTKPYKGQRVKEKPYFFYEIRDYLQDKHHAIMSKECEADDEISIEAWRRFDRIDQKILWTEKHKAISDFVIVSGDKDLAIIPGYHCPPEAELMWVDPLGELTPVWKEKDICAYEYWPMFNSKVYNINKCKTAIRYANKLQVRTAKQVRCPKEKWELDYIWYKDEIKQDTYKRGKNKGLGKFKRVQNGTIKTEYIHKLKGNGLKFFYAQLLMGDLVDNYSGLPGIGHKKAYMYLDNCKSEKELLDIVAALYKDEYKDAWKEYLNEQGSLAWMQTYRDEIWDYDHANYYGSFNMRI